MTLYCWPVLFSLVPTPSLNQRKKRTRRKFPFNNAQKEKREGLLPVIHILYFSKIIYRHVLRGCLLHCLEKGSMFSQSAKVQRHFIIEVMFSFFKANMVPWLLTYWQSYEYSQSTQTKSFVMLSHYAAQQLSKYYPFLIGLKRLAKSYNLSNSWLITYCSSFLAILYSDQQYSSAISGAGQLMIRNVLYFCLLQL